MRHKIPHTIIDGIDGKPCIHCKIWKSVNDYPHDSHHWDGLHSICRNCKNERNRQRYHKDKKNPVKSTYSKKQRHKWRYKNKQKLKQKQKEYYNKLRKLIINHYTDGRNRCVCCDESEEFLTIDHINNDGAEQRRRIGRGVPIFRWIIDNNYPDSIQILCYNCNSIKNKMDICPHKLKLKSD